MNFLKALFGSNTQRAEDQQPDERQKDFDTLKYDGVRALKTNETEYALRCFRHALALQDDLETRDYYSQALMLSNDMPGAYAQLQLLAAAQPDNMQIYMRMADVAYMMEDYSAMADVCGKAMQLDANDARVLYTHAKALVGLGRPDDAVDMLTKAVGLHPDAYEAYLLRGQILLEADRTDAAGQDADYLLQQLDQQEDVLMLKARVERKRGNNDEALTYYNKAVEVNPFCMDAFRERGMLRIDMGDEQEGRQDVAAAQEMTAQLEATHAPHGQGVEQQVRQAYKNVDPYGVFGNS